MADRSSAAIYADVFETLSRELKDTPTRKRIVKSFWKASFGYDFSPEQMEIDEILIALGLAKLGVDKRYGDDEMVLYANINCTDFGA